MIALYPKSQPLFYRKENQAMLKPRRWLRAAAALTLAAALSLPASAAPGGDDFASFLISAPHQDFPSVTLGVEIYRRDESGAFQSDDSVRYSCSINRVAGDAAFYIQPEIDGVWVEVDYLTDLNGDGTYEMLDGENTPVSDSLTPQGELVSWQGAAYSLSAGQTYLLTSQALEARGLAVLQARNTAGSGQSLPFQTASLPSADSLLYLITLRYNSSADLQEHSMSFYLRLYDSVIVPSDVPYGSWYYGAVEYALEQGLLSGTGSDAFDPDGTVTRAQLAQILWRLGGSQSAQNAGYPDVPSDQWYHTAVSWCSSVGLMSGTGSGFNPDGALTREQLALVLRQYAQYTGLDVSAVQGLSQFTDGGSASPWARDALGWAVSSGLLSGYGDGSLRPANGISRAELAAVLRTFCLNVLEL